MENNDSAEPGASAEQVTAPAAAPAVPVAEARAEVTLEEFCVRLSSKDRRVELLSAFHFDETRAGRFKDAESAYQARFEAFVNKPV